MTNKNKLFFGMGSLVTGILFIIISYLVNKDVFRSLDYDSMIGLQSIFVRNVDIPFSIVTILGSTEITLTILAIMFWYLFFKKKHLFSGLFLFSLIFIIEIFGKLIINHPMPPKIFLRYAFNIHLPISFFVDTHYSYPSGHMARMSFIVTVILFIIQKSKLKFKMKLLSIIILLFILIITFISRVYLGEHWLSDVFGGLLLGGGLGLLSFVFW